MLYFLLRGILGFLREGYAYLLSTWRLLGICKLVLAASVCGLHLSRCAAATQQWASYLRHPRDAFTDFYPVARQSQMYTAASALLLFVLVLKVTRARPRKAGLFKPRAECLHIKKNIPLPLNLSLSLCVRTSRRPTSCGSSGSGPCLAELCAAQPGSCWESHWLYSCWCWRTRTRDTWSDYYY